MRIAIKIGTSTLTEGGDRLSRPKMIDIVRQISRLHNDGHEMLLVSSGAIFAGYEVLHSSSKRKDILYKQVLAAIGQVKLMGLYEQLFNMYNISVAQALLTRADLADRGHYLNARNTLLSLISMGIIPIINENDVVAIEEIKIGDNDNLSAHVANLVDADLLIVLTDRAGLFTADPHINPDAELIPEVKVIDDHIRRLAGDSQTASGTGGMATKIEAAEFASRSGTEMVIASGFESDILLRLVNGDSLGTRFPTINSHGESRKQWILNESPKGTIQLTKDASSAITRNSKGILPAGITQVKGQFNRGDAVFLIAPNQGKIARGITNYSSGDLETIRGHQSDEIQSLLGYHYGNNVINHENLILG